MKKAGMMKKVGLGVVASGLIAGAATVQAVEFDATATVQNTLAVSVVQPMSWGTLFANGTSDDYMSGLTMNPEGNVTPLTAVDVSGGTPTGDAPAFLSLGGATAARGLVATNQPFTLKLPTFEVATSALTDTTAIPLTISNGDPSVAQFFMTNFTVGDFIGVDDEATDVVEVSAGIYDVDPGFSATEVEFGIGANIYTDADSTVTYEAGTYEGSFTVTAEY